MKKSLISLAVVLVFAALFAAAPSGVKARQDDTALFEKGAPLFPTDIAAAETGEILISNRGDRTVRVYSYAALLRGDTTPEQTWHFEQIPTGVAVKGRTAYVTTFTTSGALHIYDLVSGTLDKVIPAGHGATAPVVSPDGSRVYVMDQFAGTVSEIDPSAGTVTRTVRVLREPKGAVISPDGKRMFVTNYLPATAANADFVAADVSVIDLETFRKIKDIKLANGSNALRGIALSPDGKYALISHNLGRFTVPTSQLQQGWMNTSAISVIDVATLEFKGAILLDEPEHGAAGIWDIKPAGDLLVVSHSGTHDLSLVNYPAMIERLNSYKGTIEQLSYDLRFLYGLRERLPVHGNGPRKMALLNGNLYIPTFFSDTLNILNLTTRQIEPLGLVHNRAESREQAGERIFNDAKYCFQQWQSCNGCHPGDARNDGLNWDLMNDGIGNSKNCKSLLYSHVTPPSMISGIRASAELAVRKGFNLIQFYAIPEEDAKLVDDYMKSLRPVPSPLLVNGELSDKAKEGRKVFEKLGCDHCHNGPYFSDMSMHRIGEDIEFANGWDTPTLIEVWRTAPYLFDGRANTMEEVFAVHHHGIREPKKVNSKEIEQLVEYVNSL